MIWLVLPVERPCIPPQNLEFQAADFQVKNETFEGSVQGVVTWLPAQIVLCGDQIQVKTH
jgi:hypothetical protein